jgi:hypothetical protein
MEEMAVMNVDTATQNRYQSIHIVKAPNLTNLCRAKYFSAPSEIMYIVIRNRQEAAPVVRFRISTQTAPGLNTIQHLWKK